MKKLIIALFVSFIAVGFASKSRAIQPNVSEAWNITEVSLSSTVVCRQCFVKQFWLTSGTAASTDYAFLADTPNVTANASVLAISSNTRKTVPVYFTTATVIGNAGFPLTTSIYSGFTVGDGDYLYFSSACFFYKTSAASGEALKGYLKWK